MMVIDNKFEIGQMVFLKTDREQLERMITRIIITPIGISYGVNASTVDTWHYEIELTAEKNVLV